jgi:hypothetical protein
MHEEHRIGWLLWFYIPLALIALFASLWMRRGLELRASQVDDAFDDWPPIDPAKLNLYVEVRLGRRRPR